MACRDQLAEQNIRDFSQEVKLKAKNFGWLEVKMIRTTQPIVATKYCH